MSTTSFTNVKPAEDVSAPGGGGDGNPVSAGTVASSSSWQSDPAGSSPLAQEPEDMVRPRPFRSKAWIYYTVLAIASLVMACGGRTSGLLGAALFGLYARYLFRGGRFVLWIW